MTTDLTAYFTALREKIMGDDVGDAIKAVEAIEKLDDIIPALVIALVEIIDAYDKGGIEFNSPEIGDPKNDIPMHPWHEEWLYYARAPLDQIRERVNMKGQI